jgi:hypothetical protein
MAGKVQSFKYEIQTKGKAFYHFRHAEISKKNSPRNFCVKENEASFELFRKILCIKI